MECEIDSSKCQIEFNSSEVIDAELTAEELEDYTCTEDDISENNDTSITPTAYRRIFQSTI